MWNRELRGRRRGRETEVNKKPIFGLPVPVEKILKFKKSIRIVKL